MGKATGFLEYSRRDNGDVPPLERVKTFAEFHEPLRDKGRREQAARCMDCGVPFCQSAMRLSGMYTGCPLHNLIPEWNDEIYRGHFAAGANRLLKTSNFPEFTGRVCPALCEKACINGQYGDPVTIHDNERFLIETAWENGTMKPCIPKVRSGKSVAVIGSGPSGLAVADTLNHRGHTVTVFEREDRVGGLLMYGIPNMKLDKSVVARRRLLMEAEGVTFKTGVNVGKDVTAQQLLGEFDAVVLAVGAKQARALAGADPSKIKGIYYAVDFLKSTTKSLLGSQKPEDECRKAPVLDVDLSVESFRAHKDFISAKGKNVVIVGGGDTGNDCIATVLRHGCRSVTALEMMPQPPVTRAPGNPWPEWPKVLKTDYGHQEAEAVFGHDPRIYETTVKEFKTDKDGNLTSIITSKVKFENRKMELVKGTEKEIPCELLLIAAGFVGCEPYVADAFKAGRTQRGCLDSEEDGFHVKSDKTGRLFAAGDCRRGQSLVVWAVSEGRRCAAEVDEYLMGYTPLVK